MASSRAPSATNVSVGKVSGVVRMLTERGLGASERSSSSSLSSKDGQEPGSARAPLPAACAASDYKPSPRPRLTVLGVSNADAATANAATQEKAQCRALCVASDLPDYASAVHSEQNALPAQRCALLSRRFPSVRIARVAPVIVGSA